MSQETIKDGAGPIRITAAEASSEHVDDLLKRLGSLRGDTGITRDRGRKWYLQNWFVLALAGLLATVLGWAVLKPMMADMPYVQGPIQSIAPNPGGTIANVKIHDDTIPIVSGTLVQDEKGKWVKVNINALNVGDQLGVYVEEPRDAESARAALAAGVKYWARFVVIRPPESGETTTDIETQEGRHRIGYMLFFPVVAGLVGLFIGATDGIMCRLWRRVLMAGGIGLIVGLVGGFVSQFIAGLVYAPISEWASHQTGGGVGGLSTIGFITQIGGRALGWALAGMAMGLGQGLALRSPRVIAYGFLGGVLGGLFGGILFDPIYFMISGEHSPDAHLSRLVSLCVIGLGVGGLIGLVELLARDAWLRMVAGPLSGKEFLIFKNTMQVGASPRSDIYLFNDDAVAQKHAIIRSTGDLYEIEAASDVHPLTINGRGVQRTRLRHGDQIGLGRTVFVFQRKRG